MSKHAWRPLTRSNTVKPLTQEDIDLAVSVTGGAADEMRAALEQEVNRCEYWINDLYQVQVRRFDGKIPCVHLNIRRRDGRVILRDWRHFQNIKNELVGPECEAIELYPAESRLSDTANKYHLWCVADPTYRFPFGMQGRDVIDKPDVQMKPGFRQRKFNNVTHEEP
jgi:hypothetical protein